MTMDHDRAPERILVQVHFPYSTVAMVLLQSTLPADREQFGDLLVFASFTFRQMANLPKTEQTKSLANLLEGCRDETSLLGDRLVAGGLILRDYEGELAERYFEGRLELRTRGHTFKIIPIGFPYRGSDLAYYAPMSVLAFLRHLAKAHLDDDAYLRRLAIASHLCGRMFVEGHINMLSQEAHAYAIADAVVKMPLAGGG